MPKFIPAHPKYALPKQKTRSKVKQHSVVQVHHHLIRMTQLAGLFYQEIPRSSPVSVALFPQTSCFWQIYIKKAYRHASLLTDVKSSGYQNVKQVNARPTLSNCNDCTQLLIHSHLLKPICR